MVCVIGRTILRYSYIEDEWTTITEKRHGERMLAISPDASVIACEGAKEVHFISSDNGRLLFSGRTNPSAVGAGGRAALCERKGIVRLMRGVAETRVNVPGAPYWLAYSLDGAQLVWGDQARRFGVIEHRV